MGQYFPPKPSAHNQYALLKIRNPRGTGEVRHGRLTWRWDVQPTPVSRLYNARLLCNSKGWPEVFIDSPDLRALAGEKIIPHLYDQKAMRLCLYLPGTGEWTNNKVLANTVVPWTSLWLLFFEEWLWSGEWKGGGIHPPVDERKKDDLQS